MFSPSEKDARDRVLNTLCVLLLLIMGICAWVAVQHLQLAEKRPAVAAATMRSNSRNSRVAFTQPDLAVLVAVLLFFAAFFLAMFTQYRADVTLCRALCRLWATNRNWRIRNYRRDSEEQKKRSRKWRGNEKETTSDIGNSVNEHERTTMVANEACCAIKN